jgi:HCOMODA/2-hydroxy-3-carboxy-muconic semialdehyde decarboxylase
MNALSAVEWPAMPHHCSRRQFLALSASASAAAVLTSRRALLFAGQAPSSAGPVDSALIDDLVTGNRILAREQVVDAFGHISARHPRSADRFLLARSVAPELVTAADIMEYDLDGNPVDARGRVSYRERFIHSEIYRARSDVKAVVHCHTASLIPFGITHVPLRPVYHQGSFLADGVPVFEIRDAGGMTDMLVGDAKLGRALAQTLANKPVALMRGHGAVVVGDSIPLVVGRSVYLDLNAKAQAQAIALGGKITFIDPEEARKYLAPNNYERAWELWKKQVSR